MLAMSRRRPLLLAGFPRRRGDQMANPRRHRAILARRHALHKLPLLRIERHRQLVLALAHSEPPPILSVETVRQRAAPRNAPICRNRASHAKRSATAVL